MRHILTCVFALFLASLPQAVMALPLNPTVKAPPHALTPEDLNAWLDGLIPAAMRAADIPGGAVVVVKDGKVLAQRGYGYADKAKLRSVDAATTLFAIGSITKTFTWTAVMQLVEQGKIDLDVDVNRYLDFRIPPHDGKPVTMRQILTMTTGFEERLKYLIGPTPQPSLEDYMHGWVPERIFPAGQVPTYSNYAATLAGYIVQRVSGEPFDTYLERHILQPLGMQSSSIRQPLPRALRPRMSRGYITGAQPAGFYEYFGVSPAGAIWSTTGDMARYMIAHLQNGQLDTVRILAPETAVRMHAIQPKIYPALPGVALGFYEHSRNGHRILAHNGGTQYFYSDMHLFLDDGIGIFISFNSPGVDHAASGIHAALYEGFADRYLTAEAAPAVQAPDAATALAHAALVVGPWEDSRRADSSFLKLLGLLGPIEITAGPDGTINLPIPGHVMTLREIAPFVWRDLYSQTTMQVLVKDGKPVMLGLSLASAVAFLPIPEWRSPTWVVPALLVAFGALLLTGLSWPIAALVRRRYNARLAYQERALLAYRLTRGLSLATAILFAAIFGAGLSMALNLDSFTGGMDPMLLSLKVLGVSAFVATFLVALWDLLSHWKLKRTWFGRLWSVVVVLSSGMIVWTAWVFHIVNLSSNY